MMLRGTVSATTAQLADLLGVPTDQVRRRLHVPRRRGEWVSPAHGLWIPVPLEFRAWGAPQGSELVDTLMRHMGVDYYVGWLGRRALRGCTSEATGVSSGNQSSRSLASGRAHSLRVYDAQPVSYTHLRAHETVLDLV